MNKAKQTRERPKYQEEPVELRAIILDQVGITPLQLMRIVAWKSAKGLASLTLNSEDKIAAYTKPAVALARRYRTVDVVRPAKSFSWNHWLDETRKVIGQTSRYGEPSGLLAIDGIGYPVATAVLAILNESPWV